MRCDDARPALSASLDERLDAPTRAALDDHLAGCGACTEFGTRLHRVRQQLRIEVADGVPDLSGRVRAAVADLAVAERDRRPRVVTLVAAAAIAALAAGLVVRAAGGPTPPAAADLAERVVAAQARIATLRGDVTIVERGFAGLVPERRFTGTLAYRAPEQLRLDVRDRTAYPSSAWRRNDVTIAIDDDTWFTRGPAPCPRDALPGCTPPSPRERRQVGREPFAPDLPAPLDLVVPVASFAADATTPALARRDVDGRPAIGVRVTVAQLAPLVDGIRLAGNWRDLHPTDVADVWLDESTLVPLVVRVRPSADPDRAVWAATRGYRDDPRTPILEWRLTDVVVDAPVPAARFDVAADGASGAVDAGFVDVAVAAARPGWLPAGMRLHRQGRLVTTGGPTVDVRAWSDGRAWVKVRTTAQWPGGRLFGSVGDAVRTISLGRAGTAYVGDGGHAIAVHAPDVDVVVTGSVSTADLRRVAASLAGVRGVPVPPDWAEATVTDRTALRSITGALAGRLDGFDRPSIRVTDETATLTYVGPGDRAVVLTESPASVLAPPLEPDVRAVTVRGTVGRYTPSLGEVAWTERGVAMELRSATLSLDELLIIARRLRPA